MLVVIGIGGSYLGARAVIEAVKGQMYNCTVKNGPQIFFVGNSISPAYFQDILDCCKGKRISLNIISKSGTTTEPALAFRVLRRMLEEQVGAEEAKKRIYATTDRARGTLKQLADAEGWETFVVPDDVGGRFSVLTAVGLLPIACAGCDIDALMAGAAAGMEKFSKLSPENLAVSPGLTDVVASASPVALPSSPALYSEKEKSQSAAIELPPLTVFLTASFTLVVLLLVLYVFVKVGSASASSGAPSSV